MLLDRSQILGVDDGVYETVRVPEWGGEVRIRSLTGEQKKRLVASAVDGVVGDSLCCVMGIVDREGCLVFKEEEADILGKKHPFVVDELAGRILHLTGWGKEAREELEKKRMASLTNGSGSTLPGPSTQAADLTSTSSSESPRTEPSSVG